MPEYLWDCDDGSGKRVVLSLPAQSVEESRETLVSRGYKDLRLQTEDICAAARESFVKASFGDKPAVLEVLTPEQRVHMMRHSAEAFPRLIVLRILKESALVYSMALGVIGWHLWQGRSWRVVDTILVLVPVAFSGYVFFIRLPSLLYRKLNLAREWNRWDECLRIASQLETLGKWRWTVAKVPASELARNRATAFAGQKKLAEALKVYAPFGDGKEIPDWLYLAHLSAINSAAKEFDKAIECGFRAIEKAPTSSLLYIDQGWRLIFRKHDVLNAKLALEKAETLEIVEFGKMFLSRLKGAIALEEANYASARKHLQKSLAEAEPFKNALLMEGNIKFTKALLCIAEGKLGNRHQAKAYLAEVEEYFQAKEEHELLHRCADAVQHRSP